ncbi:hypothetical protein SAMN02745181_3097 [Rubritalea squalenifaciens DSM 18772]|uniref:DUF2017 domain-containing protein n=2 Tax=Rubritalea TaxID=361050 RepID=A0A1M6P7H9_9BACT|nr:hypothetical protein [Rubritalea squalenifaciens]SHK03869.1 hypothetical protein SAMN02745181_3097 [Rubritalea squalenifaciens DSM 18772]
MRVAPTLEGGLRIDADNPHDWLILEMICTDAANMPGKCLPDRLSAFMETDDDWDEFVTPELRDQFASQIVHVSKAISSAEKENDLTGSLFIQAADAETWYGAINQARLSLEAQFRLSNYTDEEEIDEEDTHILAAYVRNQFYSSMQSILLEYLIK